MASTLLRSSKIGLALQVSDPALALIDTHLRGDFSDRLPESVSKDVCEEELAALC
jgi:hypothetical protein